jgi:hypothetical protein
MLSLSLSLSIVKLFVPQENKPESDLNYPSFDSYEYVSVKMLYVML